MAISNNLSKTQNNGNKTDAGVVKFEVNGQQVKLTLDTVKRYLVQGQGNVTDQEAAMFMSLCKFQRINPFLREAYLIKYGDRTPASMVVAKETLIKRAFRNPNFDGFQAGIIVMDDSGTEEREGTFYQSSRERIVGGWARVFCKEVKTAFYASVCMEEYVGRKGDGSTNGQWASKPATMIRKVALAQALREAFPEDLNGLYEPEELNVEVDSNAPIRVPEEDSAPETAQNVSNPDGDILEGMQFDESIEV